MSLWDIENKEFLSKKAEELGLRIQFIGDNIGLYSGEKWILETQETLVAKGFMDGWKKRGVIDG